MRVIYFVPSGAPNTDRADLMMEASQQVQAQWANWGLTFRLEPDIETKRSGRPCSYFQGGYEVIDRVRAELGGLNDTRVKYLVYVECSSSGVAATSTDGHVQMFFDGVLNGIDWELANNFDVRSDVGSIGHELGHGFSMPHENCGGREAANATELQSFGLPSYGTISIMCNGGRWPVQTEDPGFSWILDRMLRGQWDNNDTQGCDWFFECAGGEMPSVADTPLTVVPGTFVNNNGFCLDVSGASREWGQPIQTWGCNGTPAQMWRAIPAKRSTLVGGEGTLLRAAHSGQCLTIDGASHVDGASTHQWGCAEGNAYADNRKFDITNGGEIRALHSDKCLTATGGQGSPVVQQTCDGSAAQRWTASELPRSYEVGDPSCDGEIDIVDSLLIVQYETGTRTDSGLCPLPDPQSQLHALAVDVDLDGMTTVVDALLIARCSTGVVDPACPE